MDEGVTGIDWYPTILECVGGIGVQTVASPLVYNLTLGKLFPLWASI